MAIISIQATIFNCEGLLIINTLVGNLIHIYEFPVLFLF